MNARVAAWLFFRGLRWLLLIVAAGYYVEVLIHLPNHLTAFRQLLNSTELLMYGLPLAAMVAACFELMMREKAGLTRPKFGQLIPPAATASERLP